MFYHIFKNDELSRFEIFVDLELAGYLNYSLSDDLIFNAIETFIYPQFRGRELGKYLVLFVLKDCKIRDYNLNFSCKYAEAIYLSVDPKLDYQ